MPSSENIVLAAPLSFSGSFARIAKLTKQTDNPYIRWLLIVPATVLLILLAWVVVACWYLVFGIFLVPYRLLRRSQRREKRDRLRHQEIMSASQTKTDY